MNKLGLFIIMLLIGFASIAQRGPQIEGDIVFENDQVVFRQLDERTWIGSGNVMSSESLYLVEGNSGALLIDAGTSINNLDEIVASITDKPVMLATTHVHPDHVGSAGFFPKLHLNAADTAMLDRFLPEYDGELVFIENGQEIDLGGRIIEVFFTPPHTPGSTTYFDKTSGYGFSGDSFGSGNLLLFGTFSELISTCEQTLAYMKDNGIDFLYPGHFFGKNQETPKRLTDMIALSKDVLKGKVKGQENPNSRFGLGYIANGDGFRINYSSDALK